MIAFSDRLERAAWTALETFVAVMAAAGTEWVSVSVVKGAAIAAVAAGLSALKTTVVQARG